MYEEVMGVCSRADLLAIDRGGHFQLQGAPLWITCFSKSIQ